MVTLFQINKKLPTDLKKVNPFIKQVIRKLLLVTRNKNDVFKIRLALEEALTNAMRHGNLLDAVRKVCIHIKADSKKIIMEIHDEGKGFDFQSLPDPTNDYNATRPCGRGVYLMRALMDKVEFYDSGCRVRLTKQFSKPSI